jgi:hypothetical protein
MTTKSLTLPLPGVMFGQSPKQVSSAVDKMLDDDYRPLYRNVQPGVRMKELDNQLIEDKAQFRRSRIDFGSLPTGIDQSPLHGEYTYNNNESMMSLTRNGVPTYLFFIQERLWKIIEEHKLSDSDPLGKNFTDAVVKMSTGFGVPGRVIPQDATHPAVEVDWRDSSTHFRVIQRSEDAMALGYESLSTLQSLGSLRVAKAVDDNAIDPAVAAAVRGGPSDSSSAPKSNNKKK